MDARPRIWQANLLVFLILIVVAVLGSVAQVISMSWGLLFTEFVLILLPTLAFVAWGTWRGWFRPRQVLNLRRIDRAGVGLSLLLGFAGWPVAVFIATITEKALSLVGVSDSPGLCARRDPGVGGARRRVRRVGVTLWVSR